MTFWKTLVGLAAACAACCALPLLTPLFGAMLLGHVNGVLTLLALAAAAVLLIRHRRRSACETSCERVCDCRPPG